MVFVLAWGVFVDAFSVCAQAWIFGCRQVCKFDLCVCVCI